MPTPIDIDQFIKLSETYPVLDVRTPAEYEQGHIPGAINLPLFTNEERIVVGTLYKQKGKQTAVLKGLEIVGPKLQEYVKEAIKLNRDGNFLVHCWRGGMRSSSMAWFIETYGFKCFTLKGGYKNYRKNVLSSFNATKNIILLGGRTGSGKTKILKELKKLGEQVIDLEMAAHHRGSSFGALGETPVTQEQFENDLALQFSETDPQKNTWVENESRMIGTKVIPSGLWDQMNKATVISIDLPIEVRIEQLVKEYGKYSTEELIAATERISRKLGGQHAKRAIDALKAGDHSAAFEICLVYYDKTYQLGEEKREKGKVIHCEFKTGIAESIAKAILKYGK